MWVNITTDSVEQVVPDLDSAVSLVPLGSVKGPRGVKGRSILPHSPCPLFLSPLLRGVGSFSGGTCGSGPSLRSRFPALSGAEADPSGPWGSGGDRVPASCRPQTHPVLEPRHGAPDKQQQVSPAPPAHLAPAPAPKTSLLITNHYKTRITEPV